MSYKRYWGDQSVWWDLGLYKCNLKVDPKRYGSYGSYELLVKNIGPQMNENSIFYSYISSNISEML